MSPPRKILKTDEGEVKRSPDGVIRFEVDNISKLDEDGRYSSEVEVGGVMWKARVALVPRIGSSLFFVWLHSLNEQASPWMIDVDAEFVLLHTDRSKSLVRAREARFDYPKFTCLSLMDWDEFVANDMGFIVDDKVTVEIRFWISNTKGIKTFPRINFTDPDEPSLDIALVIEGQKIYANKGILTAHSSFFKSLFHGDFMEKNKAEIELKDLNPEEFIEMLRVIHPTCKKITKDSVEYLLNLGDRFQIAYLIDCAEKYLIDAKEMSRWMNLKLAEKYRLFGLLEHAISEMNTTMDFKELEESPIFNELSDETKLRLSTKLRQIKGDQNGLRFNKHDFVTYNRFDFTNSNDPCNDIAIVIDGEKIYANKAILAAHSRYFDSKFYWNPAAKEKKEIELKNVDREEFLEMLHIIYPTGKKITDESAEYLIKLGKIFQIKDLIDRAEKALIGMANYEMSNKKKLRIAKKYKLRRLEEHSRKAIKIDEENRLYDDEDYDEDDEDDEMDEDEEDEEMDEEDK